MLNIPYQDDQGSHGETQQLVEEINWTCAARWTALWHLKANIPFYLLLSPLLPGTYFSRLYRTLSRYAEACAGSRDWQTETDRSSFTPVEPCSWPSICLQVRPQENTSWALDENDSTASTTWDGRVKGSSSVG